MNRAARMLLGVWAAFVARPGFAQEEVPVYEVFVCPTPGVAFEYYCNDNTCFMGCGTGGAAGNGDEVQWNSEVSDGLHGEGAPDGQFELSDVDPVIASQAFAAGFVIVAICWTIGFACRSILRMLH